MRILLIGAGGVGDAIVKISADRNFFEKLIVSDYDIQRAEKSVDWVKEHSPKAADKFQTAQIDASDSDQVAALAKEVGATHIMNAVEPKFVQSIFDGALKAGVNYMDMAMSLSHVHKTDPFNTPAEKLGDWQYDKHAEFEKAGLLALIGTGAEPGISNIFARYAADHLFSEVDEICILDGGNLVVRNEQGEEIFAPSFSIWTVIEECLNPPLIWEKDRGWYTTEPFSEPAMFEFPGGIGPIECVNVEHEEVNMLPRTMDAQKVRFKYGLGTEFIGVLQTLHALGLDKTEPVSVRSKSGRVEVAPRDLVAAVLPDPASLVDSMTGMTCAGTLVTGKGLDGKPRATYLYHVADTSWTGENYNAQAVVWQTALVPVVALELLSRGDWKATGVRGPEEFDAKLFLDLMSTEYKQPWGSQDRNPENPSVIDANWQ
ncbi:MAG: saccharopine dehydrogenase NADP-binding domain-containing protein [Aquiluna sp.]|nr:saccharopine dehydrogenase NADP-binding domain-containing protein [Aquiluna sp.]